MSEKLTGQLCSGKTIVVYFEIHKQQTNCEGKILKFLVFKAGGTCGYRWAFKGLICTGYETNGMCIDMMKLLLLLLLLLLL
jgi:hypothetical protein